MTFKLGSLKFFFSGKSKEFYTVSRHHHDEEVDIKITFLRISLSFFLLFHNILSDCHNSDVINSLLNAFRLKRISEINICFLTRWPLSASMTLKRIHYIFFFWLEGISFSANFHTPCLDTITRRKLSCNFCACVLKRRLSFGPYSKPGH
jgi:hypothetical protein